jgi:hypothetical protein
MSDTANKTPADADAIRLLTIPTLSRLLPGQVRGALCVWCETILDTATAVAFGEPRDEHGVSTFPRGCRTCVHQQAYLTLLDHAPTCEPCVDDPDACSTGVALRALMREFR